MDEISTMILDQVAHAGNLQLTNGQHEAVRLFSQYLADRNPQSVFMLKGLAGTGKTFMIRLFSDFLRTHGYKVILLAPTGRAAKVVSRRARRYASTIHRYIYSVDESMGGAMYFRLKDNRDPEKTFYIVDEASMIGDHKDRESGSSSGLLEDLLRFVQQELIPRRIMFVGDPAQLPPVGSGVSPALDGDYIAKKYRMFPYEVFMEEVMRQEEGSGILDVAVAVRNGMETEEAPAMELQGLEGVQQLLNGQEAIEHYMSGFSNDDLDRVVLITYSNWLSVQVNQAIRAQLLEATEPLIEGEVVMVVRNNYAWGNKEFPFIANGEMAFIRHVYRDSREEKYGLTFMDADIEFRDQADKPVFLTCKVVLDLLTDKSPQLSWDQMNTVYRARMSHPDNDSRAAMKKDPYLNALQIKYGYAITCHKAQGGQWKEVIVAFEPRYGDMPLKDHLRWTYTAFTRAEERLYLMNCPYVRDNFT